MKRCFLISAVAAIVCIGLASGCNPSRTAGDNLLRSEPALTIPHVGRAYVIDPSIRGLVGIYSVNREGKITRAAWDDVDTGAAGSVEDMINDIVPYDYLAVDVSAVVANPSLGVRADAADRDAEIKRRRNMIADVIIFAADHNYNLYMHRVLAFNRTRQISNNILNTIFNSGEVIAGLADGSVAAGIAGAQLAVNSVNSEIDSQLFFDKSVEAIDKILRSERQAMLLELDRRLGLSIEDYSVTELLRDLEVYSETASFRFIAYALQSTATEAEQDTNSLIANAAKTPSERRTDIPTSISLPTRSDQMSILEDRMRDRRDPD